MSVSLYYTAKRGVPITGQERAACPDVVERYLAEYPLGELYEGFCIYDCPAAGVLLDGATKLPLDQGQEHLVRVLDYWADCLQEIIALLPGAGWHIHLDDVDLTPHFHFPQ